MLLLILLLLLPKTISSECDYSYIIVCANISDYREGPNIKWSEVLIKAEDPGHRVISDFDVSLFSHLKELTIVGQLNKMTRYRYSRKVFLENLILYDNDFGVLRKGDINFSCQRMEKFNLAKNNIKSIDPLTFNWCQPKTIDLSNNHLEVIHPLTFGIPKYNQIRSVILKKNKLKHIKPQGLPVSLELLDIEDNSFEVISDEVFGSLPKFRSLMASKNRISMLPNMTALKNLEVVDFSHNQIIKIDSAFGKNQNLRIVDLSHNRIIQIDSAAFGKNHNVRFLDLGHNQLTNAEFLASLYYSTKSFTYIIVSLAFNQLEDLKYLVKPKTGKRKIIRAVLYGNPWWCRDWLKIEKYMTKNHMIQDKCERVFFSQGRYPFCIGWYPTSGSSQGNFSYSEDVVDYDHSSEVKNFLNIIKDAEARHSHQCKEVAEKIYKRELFRQRRPAF